VVQNSWCKIYVPYQQIIISSNTFSKEINKRDISMETGTTPQENLHKSCGEFPNSPPTALALLNASAGTNTTTSHTLHWIQINPVTTVTPLEALTILSALAQLPLCYNTAWLSSLLLTTRF
jgi:hypothetical protein